MYCMDLHLLSKRNKWLKKQEIFLNLLKINAYCELFRNFKEHPSQIKWIANAKTRKCNKQGY